MIGRAVAGVALAACIAVAARAAGALTRGGAIAATIIGALAVSAGWSWGSVLILYFVASTLLSRLGRSIKERRTASIVAKGGERDAVQVLANGALFGGAALAMIAAPNVRWVGLAIGSLAASAADTWATEIGTLYGREPRSIVSWRRVPAGTSGGVSLIGTIGGVAGAAFVAMLALLLGWTGTVASRVALGGICGALVDSLLGATVQARRWCDSCERETERGVHDCGAATRPRLGFGWLDNDLVNFISNVSGGVLTAFLLR